MLKIGIALVLLAHGIGHSMGLLQVFKVATVNPAWHGDSWILTGPAGATVTNLVGSILWIASIVGFAALAAVVVGWLPATWFAPLAVGSAAASLAGIALFPVAFPLVSTLGEFVVDAVVLAGVLWFHWLPTEVTA
jgi:hypothetical protein